MRNICFDNLVSGGIDSAWLGKIIGDVHRGVLTKGECAGLVVPRARVSRGIERREWATECDAVIILLDVTDHIIRYELGGIPNIEKTPVHVFGSTLVATHSKISIGGANLEKYEFLSSPGAVFSIFGMWILNQQGFPFRSR